MLFIAFLRHNEGLKGSDPAGSNPASTGTWSSLERPRPPVPQSTAADSIQEPNSRTKLFESWEHVPTRFLALPLAIGDVRPKGAQPLTYFYFLGRFYEESKLFGFDPMEVDAERRAFGLAQTVDYFILNEASIPIEGGPFGAGLDPEFYAPVGMLDGAAIPDSVEDSRKTLLNLWKQGSTNPVIGRLPPQHRFEGIEQVVRCRELAILASLGTDPEVQRLLQGVLEDTGEPPSIKAAAFTGLLLQEMDQDAAAWLTKQSDVEVLRAVAGGLFPSEIVTAANTRDPLIMSTFGSHVSTTGRGIDDHLLRIYDSSTDEATRADLAAALAGRVDNPAVRDKVLTLLKGEDSNAIIQVLRQRPALVENHEYRAILGDLLASTDFRVRCWALENYALIPDPGVRDVIESFLADPDPRFRLNALGRLSCAGLYDPAGTIRIISRFVEQNPDDWEIRKEAGLQIQDLRSKMDDPEGFRLRNEKWLMENGLRNP
jgi:hypothetical protein